MHTTEQLPSNVEQEPVFEAGVYDIDICFRDLQGREQVLKESIRLWKQGGKEDLEKAAWSHVVSIGLHNFGLDAYVGRYPNGHPVRLVIYRRAADGADSAVVHEATVAINGSGYPVES